MGTLLLKNGTVIDGSGQERFRGHLLIEGDKISAVLKDGEPLPGADEVMDVEGRIICPGFIDMHSHADWLLSLDDHPSLMKCLVEQGVTTVVAGNCGASPAPFKPQKLKLMNEGLAATIIDRPFDYEWSSMGEFLDRMEESGSLVNTAQLAGHASVRLAGSDKLRGALPREDLTRCLDELARSLDEGACGLSFGLGYDPGMYSPTSELEAFSRVAAQAGKPVTVHLKALSLVSPTYPLTTVKPHNLVALEEMIEVAKIAKAALQISHFIFVGRRSWSTAEKAVKMVEDARHEGVDVMFDAFPYTCGNTTVNVVLPYWFIKRMPEAYHKRWARAALKAELEIGFRLLGFTYSDFQIMDAAIEGEEELNGLTIDRVAEKWNTSPFDAMLKLSERTNGGALMLYHTYSGEPGREEALEAVLSHNLCLFETDALIKSRGYPNPAAMGTFPKILGDFVNRRKFFSMEEAVNRMTAASAERFGFRDRGVLEKDKAADVVIFGPEEISDTPPKGNIPAGKPKGIDRVFINGTKVVENGEYMAGPKPGKVLRK